jgi:hypothetical protein
MVAVGIILKELFGSNVVAVLVIVNLSVPLISARNCVCAFIVVFELVRENAPVVFPIEVAAVPVLFIFVIPRTVFVEPVRASVPVALPILVAAVPVVFTLVVPRTVFVEPVRASVPVALPILVGPVFVVLIFTSADPIIFVVVAVTSIVTPSSCKVVAEFKLIVVVASNRISFAFIVVEVEFITTEPELISILALFIVVAPSSLIVIALPLMVLGAVIKPRTTPTSLVNFN